jgi:mRNA interferase MazF
VVNRGEVWWLELPDLSPHPVLVLTRPAAIPVRRKVMVAPLTTRVRDIPIEVPLTVADDGVAQDCVVNLDNVETVPQALLTQRMTTLSEARMREVCAALATATAC